MRLIFAIRFQPLSARLPMELVDLVDKLETSAKHRMLIASEEKHSTAFNFFMLPPKPSIVHQVDSSDLKPVSKLYS